MKKKLRDKNIKVIYKYKCPDCGFDGLVDPGGYIGRCECGSYNVEVKFVKIIDKRKLTN